MSDGEFESSVVFRSVLPSERFERVMDAIAGQSLLPTEVIIVVPVGNIKEWKGLDLGRWPNLLAKCRIVPAAQGMVSQRAEGIRACSSTWALLLDDDAVLPPSFLASVCQAVKGEPTATCFVPQFTEGYPSRTLRRLVSAIFLLAVPSRKRTGPRILASGGFTYPVVGLQVGEIVPAETGAGIAILVNADWSCANGIVGDLRLQMTENHYALREDTALVYSHCLKGGRVVNINAGEIQHLQGTTRLSPLRAQWVFEAAVRNNLIFWREYVLPQRRSGAARAVARIAITWAILGICAMAVLSAMKAIDLAPLRGLVKGFGGYWKTYQSTS